MSRANVPAVERIIANTINETARGDPDALAARIVAALGEAGYCIVSANGIEDTALGSQPDNRRDGVALSQPQLRYLVPCPRRAWAPSGVRRTRRQAVR
jgi:hypothetical protein